MAPPAAFFERDHLMPRFRESVVQWVASLQLRANRVTPTSVAIYKAAKSGQLDKLEGLLFQILESPERFGLLNAEDARGRTPLSIAVNQGRIECVIVLLRHGADVHHMGWHPKGGTPLHEALHSWCPMNIIRILLSNGANPFVENIVRQTPWDMALRRNDSSLFREFEKHGKFAAYLLIKTVVPADGSVEYVRRWVVVIPRFACSRIAGHLECLSLSMLVFEDTHSVEPLFRLRVDQIDAVMKADTELGTKVILTPEPVEAAKSEKHLTWEDGKIRLVLSGSESMLTLLMKAIKGEEADIFMETPALGLSKYEDDFILAKRLQAEFDGAFSLQQDSLTFPSSPSNGAGPSTSGTSYMDSLQSPPPVEEESTSKGALRLPESVARVAVGNVGGSSSSQRESGDLCIVCLDAPKSAGFAHGNSVHWCVCKACAKQMWGSGECHCPLCRSSVDNIIYDFYTN